MSNKFDELLTDLGTGKWSCIYFLMVGFHFFWYPIHGYNAAFMVPKMKYSCLNPGNNTDVSDDSCFYYVNSSSNGQEHSCTSWTYENSTFTSTLTSEFDLVCDDDDYRAYYTSVYMLGNLIGCPIVGVLGDRYGRKIIIMGATLIYSTISILMAFLPNLNGILWVRAIMGLTHVPTHYILMLEVCEPKWRSLAGIISALPWSIGVMTLGGMGYLFRSWRDLQLATSIPILLLIPIIWLSDESPRWLIVHGHHAKALRVLRRAARLNKSKLPEEEELMEMMRHIQKEDLTVCNNPANSSYVKESGSNESTHCDAVKAAMKSSFLVCSSWIVGKIAIIMFIDYFVSAMIFYGLSINGSSYSDDPYIYMFLIGLAEAPAYIFGSPIVSTFGRRRSTGISFLMCGSALVALAFIPAGVSTLKMVLVLLGKFCTTAAFQMCFLYLTELFPTIMRQQGMSYAELGARAGSFIAPIITEILSRIVSWGPAVVFGGASIFAGFVTFLLHETKNMPLPDTVQDLKEIISYRNAKGLDEENASSEEKASITDDRCITSN